MNRQNERKLILIVDDDKQLNDSIAEFLKESCFDVISETDPERATRLARHLLVDLVILDLQMPQLDGIEVLKMLREQQPNLKAVILTGHIASYEPRLKHCKIDRILSKPPDTAKLLETVRGLTETIAHESTGLSQAPIPTAKILIVDDETECCEIVSDFLRVFPGAKFDVASALTPLEGIEKVSYFEPDFLIVDWKLPMMSGGELLERIQTMEDWGPKQIFVITGSTLTSQERSRLPAGTVIFQKPFGLEKLADLIYKRCLDLGLTG